jgi:pilus assembly protein CpaE
MPQASSETIRLLIVDDIAETRENLRKLLQFESDIEVVGAARTGEEALQMARDTQPDVVLMDINMPDMDGISATKTLLEDVPFSQIVILSVQNDADYMRRAMLAGARDFIAKPPSGDELISTVRVVSQRAKEIRAKLARPVLPSGPSRGDRGGPDRPEGKGIVLYSAKGGVGCTMLATNLALGLHTEETPTVLVDANMQFGDVSVFLNLQVKNSFVDLAARAEEIDPELVEEILMRHESGLRILAAPPRPEMAEEIKSDQVRKVLQFLKRNFAYVVVDTSRSMDDVMLAVLDIADLLVAVATPEIPAIKDARLLFDVLAALEFPRERVFFVLNKMDKKSGITSEAVSENLKRPVDGEIPIDGQAVTASINRGVPLLLGDRSKPPARNILELLAAVKQRLLAAQGEAVEAQEPDRPRRFGR